VVTKTSNSIKFRKSGDGRSISNGLFGETGNDVLYGGGNLDSLGGGMVMTTSMAVIIKTSSVATLVMMAL
jgi:hypothetical protein